jgi:uncharacterized protein YkwD
MRYHREVRAQGGTTYGRKRPRGPRGRLLAALAVLALAGCSDTGSVDPDGPDGSAGGGTDAGDTSGLDPVLVELVAIINEERAAAGRQQVVASGPLNCAAQVHSDDIGERRACTHTGSDGSSPTERVAACDGSGWNGEIVACGAGTPRGAVDLWLNSSGHRSIMLASEQRVIGVGMHQNYWTAIFNR